MATQHIRVNDDLYILIQQRGDKLEVGIAPRGGQPVRLATLDLEPTAIEVRSGIWSASTATGMSVSEDGSEIRYPDPRLTHRVSFVIDEAAHS